MLIEEDTIKINNQKLTFEEIFNKKIDYSPQQFPYLKNKTLLVTGGAGSVGTILIKQLLEQDIQQIIVLDHSEYGIFKLGLEFKEKVKSKKLHLFLGDIRNTNIINKIFSLFPIQIIYHVAAYKHIDILENNADESISVNIEASLCLLKASLNNKAEQFIFISTDKAVNPINKMGISKRIAELLLLKQIFIGESSSLDIKIIRFGNVFNSSGSVFNIFQYQIENNLPMTITNKEMKRYFISKFQSAKGLIQIANPENKSGIYILNMGDSFSIKEILHSLLEKLNLQSITRITYNDWEKNLKYEKIEEELHFPFEKLEGEMTDYKNIKLIDYNLKNIELEIENLSQLVKK